MAVRCSCFGHLRAIIKQAHRRKQGSRSGEMGARALADESAAITVTVVYARPDQVWRVAVDLPAGSRVGDALRASGLAECIGEVDLLAAPVGVFGEACERDRLLRA
ncbi:MAG TPA: hypothetical protein DDW89_11690, partial [Gammaproteobacteria bacterium]|nr:hypothetical protein [Gammaproteobacteria bacterium]